MRAKDIMTSPVLTVGPETPIKEIAAILVEHGINTTPVVDANGELVGIVSEGDLVALETQEDPRRHVIRPKYRRRPIPRVARDVMTANPVAVNEDADVALVARLMLEHRIKTIPVVRSSEVVGIVSRRDVLEVLARSDQEIRVELADLLEDEILMLGRFRAEVEGGVVTLRGPKDRAGRRLAQLLARSVPGVIEVRFAEEEKRERTRAS